MSAEELAKENAELRRKLGERENRDKEPKWDTGDTQHEHKGRRREKTDHTKDARDSRQGEERKKKANDNTVGLGPNQNRQKGKNRQTT